MGDAQEVIKYRHVRYVVWEEWAHVLRTAPPILSPLGSAVSHALLRPTLGESTLRRAQGSGFVEVFKNFFCLFHTRDTVAVSIYKCLSRNIEL